MRSALISRAVAIGCLCLLGPTGAHAQRPLTVGFSDDIFASPDPPTRALWLDRAVVSGAAIVRVSPSWSAIAPGRRPAGFDPSDPADPSYDWSVLDAAVRDASARRLEILVSLGGSPRWAEGPGRPRGAPAGSWRPDPRQFAAFARAAAERYSGKFPDPARPGAVLPRVRYWQAWNEPNLSTYLTPQWTRSGDKFVPASPVIYRGLLNAFYRAVKAVHRDNFVVSAGTAPYGDPFPGGRRISPVLFLREMLCLRGHALRPERCPHPARLDAIAHHPYAISGPLRHAFNPDDASIPDIFKLTHVLLAAERNHRVLPRGHKQIWITEVSWDSKPPDPYGVRQQAQWLEEAFYLLWRQGVDTITWFQIRDSPPVPSFASTNQSGVYYLDGRPKRSQQAFRFPFVAERRGKTLVAVWGKAPRRGSVEVQRLRAGRWIEATAIRTGVSNLFAGMVRMPAGGNLRAEIDDQRSLPWRVR